MSKINLQITKDEASLLMEYFSDEKLELFLPLLDNNRNILMIIARMLCDIEKQSTFLFDSDYKKLIKDSEINLIKEFGNFNGL